MAHTALRHFPACAVLVFGVPAFAFFNALAEEGIYRGVLQGSLERAFGEGAPPVIILATQATAYAAAHYRGGFPNGASGYLMTLAYGILLGYLRRRTNGMLSPCLAHFAADLVIGYILVLVLLNS